MSTSRGLLSQLPSRDLSAGSLGSKENKGRYRCKETFHAVKSLAVAWFSGYLMTTLKNVQLTLVSQVVNVVGFSIIAVTLF